MKPSRFRLHLSTAIILMLTASAFLWLNVQGELVAIDMLTNEPKTVYGWPMVAIERFSAFYMITKHDQYFVAWKGVCVNALFVVSILFNIGFLLESRHRRNSDGKE